MRKLLLITILLAMAGCGPEKVELPAISPLVGSWRSTVQFESGAFEPIKNLEFMYVFHADGTMTESSNYDSAPPVPPAYGVWREKGPGEYEAKYEFFTTAPAEKDAFAKGAGWLPSGHGVLTETIAIAPDGKSFTSKMRYEAFDAAGKVVEGGGDASTRGTRIDF